MDDVDEPGGTIGTADVAFDAEGAPIIKLSGEIDISNVDALRAVIEPVVRAAPARIVFDLGALEFMDSSGIALLLQVAAMAGSVRVWQPSATVRRIIEATGVADVLQIDA